MKYMEFVRLYGELGSTTKRLEKTEILSEFFRKLRKEGKPEWSYLLKGKVYADYDSREFGISNQLASKAISSAFGIGIDEINSRFNKTGDLGNVAEELVGKKKQSALFSRKLDVQKVFDNLRKITEVEGKGAVEKKMALVAELLGSAEGGEAKFIIRTLLGDLRVGVADALIIDGISSAFFSGNSEAKIIIEAKHDLANDFALIFDAASKGMEELNKIEITPGRPIKVMLPIKVESINEALNVCGIPAAVEFKYDGFRMLINKKGQEISLFTRRLENVTKQFPDVIEAVRKHVKGKELILDSEIVGYSPKEKKYKPFEAISQRIKRKYDIEKLIKSLPVEINIFDVLYYDGKNMMEQPFKERRKLVEKIIRKEEWVIRPSNLEYVKNEKEASDFYKKALENGEEGIMIKKIDAPYRQGRRVGYMVKLKPVVNDLDLVIVGAEYGTGKRAGWLTSYIVACQEGEEHFEVGMVSSGLKEKGEEGTSYDEMTNLLKPLIIEESGNSVRVKPGIIVSVTYQNIQKSPAYSSGYALRFPRITAYRPDKNIGEIAKLRDIEKEAGKGR